MRNGFVLEGLTSETLADKLVQVGEAFMVWHALQKRIHDMMVVEYLEFDREKGMTRVRVPVAEQEAFHDRMDRKHGVMSVRTLDEPKPLTITVDSSAIHETIDKAMKDLGVLGEVNRVVLMPQNGKSIVDSIEAAHRIAFNAQFTRKDAPERYRDALLLVAALAVKAVKLFDAERSHLRGICDECHEQISDTGLCSCRVKELNQGEGT